MGLERTALPTSWGRIGPECPYGANSTSNSTSRLVKILERPVGQRFAPFQRPLESAIAAGYVFQFSGRSRDGLEDHPGLHLKIRG